MTSNEAKAILLGAETGDRVAREAALAFVITAAQAHGYRQGREAATDTAYDQGYRAGLRDGCNWR